MFCLVFIANDLKRFLNKAHEIYYFQTSVSIPVLVLLWLCTSSGWQRLFFLVSSDSTCHRMLLNCHKHAKLQTLWKKMPMITKVKTTLCLCVFKAISENEVCDCNDCTEYLVSSFYSQHVVSYCWIFSPRNRPFWIENKIILLGVKCKNIILTCIGEQKVITGLYPCLYSNICTC